jgi:hypothetical protein
MWLGFYPVFNIRKANGGSFALFFGQRFWQIKESSRMYGDF